jgi:hypothetical protein|tara:strand:+ start:1757 stop:2485 length:729 start_codon:yes stop_codon:yes gene_type:complete
MASFNAFNIRLPDPNWGVNHAGDGHASNYVEGPGFASVKLESVQPTAVSVTNSGRVTSRTIVGHRWKIDISYNPMTREQFEPIFNFLMEKRGRLKPFEVVLPQYTATQVSLQLSSSNIKVEGGDIAAGAPFFKANQHSNATVGNMTPGDCFTFNDSNNSNHKKVYRVTRVTNNSDYLTGQQPATDERYYYVTPSIEKKVSDNTPLITTNPTFRVMQNGDTVSYSLGTNNLYQFNLSLIEAQP